MFYIRIKNCLPLEVSLTYPTDGDWSDGRFTNRTDGWMSSRDFKSMAEARTMALYLTSMTGRTYLPADEGDGVSPRYRIVEAPRVGDEVSYSFNGDTYPCGKVVRITKGWRVTTDDGKVFNRYKESGGWRAVGGTWWMVQGHRYEQNPHI